MTEAITEEDIISEWTIAVEALDIFSIQQLFDLRPNLLWTPLKNSSHLESDFDHFIQRLKIFKILGTSIRPVYALHHILFDYGLPGDEWINERIELVEFILKNTKGDELNTCFWGEEQNTTMHLAFFLNQPELIQQLQEKGASLSIPNKLGNLPAKGENNTTEDDLEDNENENPTTPKLIINKKDKQQSKDKVPLSTSDKFKRLRELAEASSSTVKKTERQNSTRRYFRPGHLEERKRRVLSEEEEAELEKQRLLRQKDIAILAQRSAVKNNPLFKKFEEQQQQKEDEPYKPNPIRSAASIMRDRRKLLNPADQIKRSSRVINSLKQNSYVTSSPFRQQAAKEETKLYIPKPKSRAPSPISKESSQDMSDNEQEEEPLKKEENITVSSIMVEEEFVVPQMENIEKENKSAIESIENTSAKDTASTEEKQTKGPASPSATVQEDAEPMSIGKLNNQNIFGTKPTTKPGIDIATSKVKEIINVHEHLNDEKEKEIYSTGKVFTVWKKDQTEDSPDDEQSNIRDRPKKETDNEGATVTEPDLPVETSKSPTDKPAKSPKLSLVADSLIDKTERTVTKEVEQVDDTKHSVHINKLKFNEFEHEGSKANFTQNGRVQYNTNDGKSSEKKWLDSNKLNVNSMNQSDFSEDNYKGKKLQIGNNEEKGDFKERAKVDRVELNHSINQKEDNDVSHNDDSQFDKHIDQSNIINNELNTEEDYLSRTESIAKPKDVNSSLDSTSVSLDKQNSSISKDQGSDTVNKLNLSNYSQFNADSPATQPNKLNIHDFIDEEKGSAQGNQLATNKPESTTDKSALAPKKKTDQNEAETTFTGSLDPQTPSNNDKEIAEHNRLTFGSEDFPDNESPLSTTKTHTKDGLKDSKFTVQDEKQDIIDSLKIGQNKPSVDNNKKDTFNDLEFDDNIRFDDDERILTYQQSNNHQSLRNNYSSESLVDRDITNTSYHSNNVDTPQNSYSHTQHHQYDPSNNTTPLSIQTDFKQYDSAEEATTPTPADSKPVEQSQWQSPLDQLLSNPQTTFGDDSEEDDDFASTREGRYSTSSSIDETTILNSLHAQNKAQENEITTRWSKDSESWYDPDEKRQSDDSSSRQSSSYSFKNSNSTEATRMDSSDDDMYYKHQAGSTMKSASTFHQDHYRRDLQHDIVMENTATLYQEEDDRSSENDESNSANKVVLQQEDEYFKNDQEYDEMNSAELQAESNYRSAQEPVIENKDEQQEENDYNKRSQHHDVVIENKATLQLEEDEDMDYYSTALHQKKQDDEDYYENFSQVTKNKGGATETIKQLDNFYNTPAKTKSEDSEFYGSKSYDAAQSQESGIYGKISSSTQSFHAIESDYGNKQPYGNYSAQNLKTQDYDSRFHDNQSLKSHEYSNKSHDNYSAQSFKTRESEYDSKSYGNHSAHSFKTRGSEYGDGEIVVFMDTPSRTPNPLLLSPYSSEQHLEASDSRSLIRVPSQTNTIYSVGHEDQVELEDIPHDPKNPRIEDISHYVKVLPSLRKHNEGISEFDTTGEQDNVMVKRVKSANNQHDLPNVHEFDLIDNKTSLGGEVSLSSMDISGHGKMYIGVSGAHHVLLPLPKEITYVRLVISDGEYEYMSRYEILTEQILMDYECVIDTRPGMIITVSLHVRPDYHVRPKTGWSRWFTSIRKQKEHLSGYVYPEDGAIGQTRFAVDHMAPGCYKKTYQAYFDCFNSWYARTYQEKVRREKFGDEEDFLKIVGKLNIEMLYLPVSSPSVQVPRSLRECDLTLKICQWHETCWQNGYLSLRKQGTKVWERHYYRLIGSQLIGYTTEENGRTRQVYNHFNIADVTRLSAAADKLFTEPIHTDSNEKGFFRLTFADYYIDCVSDTTEESEEWVKTLKSMIGHVQRFHYILDGIKNIF